MFFCFHFLFYTSKSHTSPRVEIVHASQSNHINLLTTSASQEGFFMLHPTYLFHLASVSNLPQPLITSRRIHLSLVIQSLYGKVFLQPKDSLISLTRTPYLKQLLDSLECEWLRMTITVSISVGLQGDSGPEETYMTAQAWGEKKKKI